MADIDELLAKYSAKGTGTPPAPSMVREPRAKTDEELGLDAGPVKAPAPRTVSTVAREGANAIGTAADDALDAATGDLYTKGRNAVANAVAPGEGDKTAADEERFNAAHPYAEGTARAVGSMSPVGAPAMEGKVLGSVAEYGAKKLAEGAPARATSRALAALTEDVKQTLKNRITEPSAQARITKVFADPAIRRAADNPARLLSLSQAGLAMNGDAAANTYAMLDKAATKAGKPGGMDVVEVTAPLLKLRKEMIDRSEHPTAVATVDRIIDQFRGGIGRDPAARVPSAEVRQFLTKQIQNPGFGRGDPLSDPPPARAALQEMSGKLKDALDGYARRVGSPAAADALRGMNDKITAYSLMEKSATEQLAHSQQAPGPFKSLARAAMGHKAEGLGGALGYLAAGPAGSVVGAASGHLAAKAPAAVDEALAGPAMQRLAHSQIPPQILAATQPVIEALSRKDPDAAKAALVQAVTAK